MEINMLKQLYNDFLIILDESVVKYTALADKNETLEMKKEADAYRVAYLCEDTFFTYYHYEKSVIADVLQLNLSTDYDLIMEYVNDKMKIPYTLRDKVLLKQRAYIVDNYVEKNNYYRMLNGLPDYEEPKENYLYVDEETAEKYRIDPTIPIHELSKNKIVVLQAVGYIDKLYEETKKKYLKFLGPNKIDIITARMAKNFAILRIPYSVSEAMWDNFILIYDQCREYFCTCIYVTEYRETIDYYDNFIAMCIMIMTIQQVIARVMKGIIDRDFFDDYCIRILFGAYEVPYYSIMDSSTKKQLLQDLNILVLNKGTNKVLYDISKILGYDRLKIYKYYLMKVQKFNDDDTPLVLYKTIIEDGVEKQVLDYEKMYEFYFQKVELQDMDTYKSLLVTSNQKSYDEITSGDPFWLEDDELLKEMYESEYNFVETKYMGISISYRLSRILFENIYLMKMIFDKKNEIPTIILDLPKLSTMPITLFDSIVMLCAIVCKQHGLKGEVLTTPSKILHVIGFNFHKDFDLIQEEIMSNPYLDNSLTRFFEDSSTYTPEGISRLYHNLYDLYDVLIEKIATTQSVEVYEAYQKLYYTIFYTEDAKWMFNVGTEEDPLYPDTFLEYIEYTNKPVFDIINGSEIDNLYELVNHICVKILTIVPDLKYLGLMAGQSEALEKMLLSFVRFFKSYTTDMIGLETIYIFDMKPELILKLIDRAIYYAGFTFTDQWPLQYADFLTYLTTVRYDSFFKLYDRLRRLNAIITLFETFPTISLFEDKIHFIHGDVTAIDNEFHLMDIIGKMTDNLLIKDIEILKDKIQPLHNNLTIDESNKLTLYSVIKYWIENFKMDTDFNLYDLPNIESAPVVKEKEEPMLTDRCKIVYVES